MSAFIRLRDPAWHLSWVLVGAPQKRKHGYWRVAVLFLHRREIDAAPVYAWRRPRFKAPGGQPQFAQIVCKPNRWGIACATCRIVCQADMNQAREECAGGQNHGFGVVTQAKLGLDADNAPVLNQ